MIFVVLFSFGENGENIAKTRTDPILFYRSRNQEIFI